MSALLSSSVNDYLPIGIMDSRYTFESSNSSADSFPESYQASASSSPFQIPQANLNALLSESCSNSQNEPFLQILDEPVEKFRFRYKSEMMGTHGSILARSHERNRRKAYPKVKLVNFYRPAIIRCSLYTAHSNKKLRCPHAHRLIVRADNNMDKDDPHEVNVSQDNDFTAIFQGMGIIHTAKKNIVEELIRKKRTRLLEKLQRRNENALSFGDEIKLKKEAEEDARKMNLNSVSLCFEAFYQDSNNRLQPVCEPVFSKPINNMKSALTGELKICRIDKRCSSCLGGEEVYILVEKVGKKNIQIKFFELGEDDKPLWEDYGKFTELDVHHQYAIVFRTPPYRDLEIDKEVEVYVQLTRPTDGDKSEPIPFMYKPSEKTVRTRKRQRLQHESMNSGECNINYPNEIQMDWRTNSNNSPELNGIENQSFTELLNNNPVNSIEYEEFFKHFSSSGLSDFPQLKSGCDDLVDTHTSKPLKYDLDPVCSGAFVLNPSNIPFAGGLKTEGICTREYIKMFDDPQNIAVDGEEVVPNAGTSPVFDRHAHGGGNAVETNSSLVKSETTGDFDYLQNVIKELKNLCCEKLTSTTLAKKVEEIYKRRNIDGDTALHAAVALGERGALNFLLQVLEKVQNRRLINCTNSKDETPLYLSVLHNQASFVKKLLTEGANVNCCNSVGNTPIHLAIRCRHNECLAEMLDMCNYVENIHKPKLDALDYEGQTPLHLSALRGNFFALQCLVENGANVNAVDSTYGRHVLITAVEEGKKEMVEYLLKNSKVDVNLANHAGNTALHYACVVDGGNAEICKLLIDAKADPLKANKEQRSKADELTFSKLADITIKEEIESDDEYELNIVEKEEDEEEDDEDDEDEDEYQNKLLNGQTSMDLARDKKEILEILKAATDCKLQGLDFTHTEVKQELPSPTEELSQDGALFDEATLIKLCKILDKSKSWSSLAEFLDYKFLVPSIRNATSPSRLLFNYADLHGKITVERIQSFLQVLGELEAVKIIDHMLVTNKKIGN